MFSQRSSKMMKRTLVMSVLTSGLLLAASSSYATDEMTTQEPVKVQLQTKDQVQKKEQIYGSQMMTSQERVEQRKKMRAAKTTEDRERIRAEHHEAMKMRAQERGVTLPDTPPDGGMGMGAGSGSGRNGGK
jgi:electron transfer flavoprotein alpha subunit